MIDSAESPIEFERRGSGTPVLLGGRRVLVACLSIALAYVVIMAAGLLVRRELHRWGLILTPWQLPLWRQAFWFHVGLGVGIAWLLYLVGRRTRVSPRWSRLALASAFPLLLVSVDRIAAVGYRAITPRIEILMPHPTRYWTFRPGFVRSDGSTTYHINEHGLRGPLVPFEKPAGQRRILFLGDSIAFGQGVRDEDSFVRRVETNIRAGGGGPEVSVVNASVTGYSPWQEYDLLKTQGLGYDPDVIVQVFCLNDIGQKFRLVKYGGRTKHLAPPEPSALEWSGLFRMIRALTFQWFGPTRAELKARETDYAPTAIIEHFGAPHIQEAIRVTGTNLARIVSLAHNAGRPIVVVCFPTGVQIDMPGGDWSRPQQWLADFCRRRGVAMLDLAPMYRRYARSHGLPGNRLFPDDIHPNKLAHHLAGEAVYAFLAAQGLLEPTP